MRGRWPASDDIDRGSGEGIGLNPAPAPALTLTLIKMRKKKIYQILAAAAGGVAVRFCSRPDDESQGTRD